MPDTAEPTKVNSQNEPYPGPHGSPGVNGYGAPANASGANSTSLAMLTLKSGPLLVPLSPKPYGGVANLHVGR